MLLPFVQAVVGKEGSRIAVELMRQPGIAPSKLVNVAYVDMLAPASEGSTQLDQSAWRQEV